MNRFLLLAISFWCFLCHGEGTKQIRPTEGEFGYLQIWDVRNGLTRPRTFATYEADDDTKLNIRIQDPTIESINFGFKPFTNDDLYFRIKDPNGTIVFGPSLIPSSNGSPGWIDTYDQAVAGPTSVNPDGYLPIEFSPTMAGDYSIEFNPNDPEITQEEKRVFDLFDITVVNTSTSTAQNGRLWSKAWDMNTNASNQSFSGGAFIYTSDGIVTHVQFDDFRPYSFIIQANSTGPRNIGNIEEDRQSIDEGVLLPEYKIFLSPPDTTEFPISKIPNINGTPDLDACNASQEYCINLSISNEGIIRYALDIDGATGIDHPRDRTLEQRVNPGENCLAWDGLDGLGNPLLPDDTFHIYISYQTGITHLLIHDAENNSEGFTVSHIYPETALSQPVLFYDDSEIGGLTNLDGCLTNCHAWDDDFGDQRTVNTWWATFFENDTIPNLTIRLNQITSTTSISINTEPNCLGQGLELFVNSTELINPHFEWFLNNENISSGERFAPNHSSNFDTIAVIGTTDAPCILPSIDTFIINLPLPDTSSITIDVLNNPNCLGEGLQLGSTTAHTENVTWVHENNNYVGSNYSPTLITDSSVLNAIARSNNPCVVSDTASILINLPDKTSSSFQLALTNSPLCINETAKFHLSNIIGLTSEASYTWNLNNTSTSSPAINFSGILSDDSNHVSVIQTPENQCILPDTATLDIPLLPYVTNELSITISNDFPCLNEQIKVSANSFYRGSTMINWIINKDTMSTEDSVITLMALEPSTIQATSKNLNTCPENDTAISNILHFTINERPNPSISIQISDTIVCPDESISLSIFSISDTGSNATFNWYHNNLPVSSSSVYSPQNLENKDSFYSELIIPHTCGDTTLTSPIHTIEVISPENPTISLAAVPPFCTDQVPSIEYTFSNISKPTVEWFINGNPHGPIKPTNTMLTNGDQLSLTMTSKSTCQDTSLSTPSVSISKINYPEFSIEGDRMICKNSSTALTITPTDPTQKINWSNGNSLFSITNSVTIDSPGWYTATITNNDLCSTTDSVEVTEKIVTVQASEDVKIELGTSTLLLSDGTGSSRDWYADNLTSPIGNTSQLEASPLEDTWYIIQEKDGKCFALDTVFIDVIPPIVIPNVITPNEDEINDNWIITGSEERQLHATIFNRWGNKVFESYEYSNDWNGSRNGTSLPMGTYYYIVEDLDWQHEYSGAITLIW